MNTYTVYALQNKQNKKIYIDMTSVIDQPIVLKNQLLNEIIDGVSKKSDFVLYILGEDLRYGTARDLMIKSIVKYETYNEKFGYNDLNAKLKVSIKPKVMPGRPEKRWL